MTTWIKIGIRNLLKHTRRSTFTVGAIALGFAGVCVFGGFTRYMFWGLRESFIYGQGNGHLTVFKKDFQEKGSLDPAAYLLEEQAMAKIREICARDPRVLIVTPQLHMTGLISNGDVSTIFVGVGRVPSDTREIVQKGKAWAIVSKDLAKFIEGKPLEDDVPHGLALARGLAHNLNVTQGSDVIMMAPTVDGQMNALNGEVFFLFSSPSEMLNDKHVSMHIKFAQQLYDTTGADRLTVLLDSDHHTEAAKADLFAAFRKAGLDVEMETWRDLCPSYNKIADMFNLIFTFLFVIVFIIVVLSVVNTISMAVMERTREIGTLRALGLKHRGVVVMFATESALLGVCGSMIGAVLTFLTWLAIQITEPKWSPPTISREVPLQIYVVPEHVVLALVCLLALAVGAAVLPARRAARMSIVDALGHV